MRRLVVTPVFSLWNCEVTMSFMEMEGTGGTGLREIVSSNFRPDEFGVRSRDPHRHWATGSVDLHIRRKSWLWIVWRVIPQF
jgi:hypothetical protein